MPIPWVHLDQQVSNAYRITVSRIRFMVQVERVDSDMWGSVIQPWEKLDSNHRMRSDGVAGGHCQTMSGLVMPLKCSGIVELDLHNSFLDLVLRAVLFCLPETDERLTCTL
jgi:hypothetical protein